MNNKSELKNIEIKLKELLIHHLQIDETPETIDSSKEYFLDDYGVNSIDLLELLLRIEQEFDIEIGDEDLNSDLLITINSISEYIHKQIS